MNTEISREQKFLYQENLQAIQATAKEIDKVIDVLTNKRRTLAEKAIQEELHQCNTVNSCLADHLSEALRRNQFCLANHICANLQQININLNKQLIAFM